VIQFSLSVLSADVQQGDENPIASANRVLQFFEGEMGVTNIDLHWLDNTTTMFGAFGSLEVTPGRNQTES
jgi:hypothetical protein